MPFTVKSGVWKGVLGIWKRELAPPPMKASRVFSSTMPVILASPYHWSVSSCSGVMDEVGFSMPRPLWMNWPAAK